MTALLAVRERAAMRNPADVLAGNSAAQLVGATTSAAPESTVMSIVGDLVVRPAVCDPSNVARRASNPHTPLLLHVTPARKVVVCRDIVVVGLRARLPRRRPRSGLLGSTIFVSFANGTVFLLRRRALCRRSVNCPPPSFACGVRCQRVLRHCLGGETRRGAWAALRGNVLHVGPAA